MNDKTYTWEAASVIQETADAVTILFDTKRQAFMYKPGQFINVQQEIDGEPVSRSYSLSSSPGEDERPAITIKRLNGGRMSNHILHHAENIRHWQVDGPHGSFFADTQTLQNGTVVLMGGGSGITPLFSILKTLLKHTTACIVLVDCNRRWSDVVFANSLTYLENVYAERLQVHHYLSRETVINGLPCRNVKSEKLTRLTLKKALKKLLAEKIAEAEYFLCGPDGLLTLSKDVLAGLDIPPVQIHFETFSPSEETSLPWLPQTTTEVLLHVREQTNLLEVQPGKTILDAAMEEKISLPYSCKSGTCGQCVAKQTAGAVHMAKNYALTEDEVAQGYVLLCQSHPLNNEVIISVG